MAFITFANQSGAVPASELDSNFAQCVLSTTFAALAATVAGLPGAATPLVPVAGGAVGVDGQFSREDHQHPPQSAAPNTQTGTSYTLQATDDGKVVEFSNAAAVAVTVPNSLPVGFSCVLVQAGAGQAQFSAGSGATQRQRSSFTRTAGQWAMVSMYVRANSGGAAAEYVLGGDMTT